MVRALYLPTLTTPLARERLAAASTVPSSGWSLAAMSAHKATPLVSSAGYAANPRRGIPLAGAPILWQRANWCQCARKSGGEPVEPGPLPRGEADPSPHGFVSRAKLHDYPKSSVFEVTSPVTSPV
jgi:hypothetical protein